MPPTNADSSALVVECLKQYRSARTDASFNVKRVITLQVIKLKSLILAQIERWRHALHMQVERESRGQPLRVEWRTGE